AGKGLRNGPGRYRPAQGGDRAGGWQSEPTRGDHRAAHLRVGVSTAGNVRALDPPCRGERSRRLYPRTPAVRVGRGVSELPAAVQENTHSLPEAVHPRPVPQVLRRSDTTVDARRAPSAAHQRCRRVPDGEGETPLSVGWDGDPPGAGEHRRRLVLP